ncbi:hypothetical protein LZ30DRAFT_401905 [Colletotrichum cereale]|nr:hypothetical protein LZ30DRAFT_401905 [Colletotrichum cereale]
MRVCVVTKSIWSGQRLVSIAGRHSEPHRKAVSSSGPTSQLQDDILSPPFESPAQARLAQLLAGLDVTLSILILYFSPKCQLDRRQGGKCAASPNSKRQFQLWKLTSRTCRLKDEARRWITQPSMASCSGSAGPQSSPDFPSHELSLGHHFGFMCIALVCLRVGRAIARSPGN